jgi:hypothetical protein
MKNFVNNLLIILILSTKTLQTTGNEKKKEPSAEKRKHLVPKKPNSSSKNTSPVKNPFTDIYQTRQHREPEEISSEKNKMGFKEQSNESPFVLKTEIEPEYPSQIAKRAVDKEEKSIKPIDKLHEDQKQFPIEQSTIISESDDASFVNPEIDFIPETENSDFSTTTQPIQSLEESKPEFAMRKKPDNKFYQESDLLLNILNEDPIVKKHGSFSRSSLDEFTSKFTSNVGPKVEGEVELFEEDIVRKMIQEIKGLPIVKLSYSKNENLQEGLNGLSKSLPFYFEKSTSSNNLSLEVQSFLELLKNEFKSIEIPGHIEERMSFLQDKPTVISKQMEIAALNEAFQKLFSASKSKCANLNSIRGTRDSCLTIENALKLLGDFLSEFSSERSEYLKNTLIQEVLANFEYLNHPDNDLYIKIRNSELYPAYVRLFKFLGELTLKANSEFLLEFLKIFTNDLIQSYVLFEEESIKKILLSEYIKISKWNKESFESLLQNNFVFNEKDSNLRDKITSHELGLLKDEILVFIKALNTISDCETEDHVYILIGGVSQCEELSNQKNISELKRPLEETFEKLMKIINPKIESIKKLSNFTLSPIFQHLVNIFLLSNVLNSDPQLQTNMINNDFDFLKNLNTIASKMIHLNEKNVKTNTFEKESLEEIKNELNLIGEKINEEIEENRENANKPNVQLLIKELIGAASWYSKLEYLHDSVREILNESNSELGFLNSDKESQRLLIKIPVSRFQKNFIANLKDRETRLTEIIRSLENRKLNSLVEPTKEVFKQINELFSDFNGFPSQALFVNEFIESYSKLFFDSDIKQRIKIKRRVSSEERPVDSESLDYLIQKIDSLLESLEGTPRKVNSEKDVQKALQVLKDLLVNLPNKENQISEFEQVHESIIEPLKSSVLGCGDESRMSVPISENSNQNQINEIDLPLKSNKEKMRTTLNESDKSQRVVKEKISENQTSPYPRRKILVPFKKSPYANGPIPLNAYKKQNKKEPIGEARRMDNNQIGKISSPKEENTGIASKRNNLNYLANKNGNSFVDIYLLPNRPNPLELSSKKVSFKDGEAEKEVKAEEEKKSIKDSTIVNAEEIKLEESINENGRLFIAEDNIPKKTRLPLMQKAQKTSLNSLEIFLRKIKMNPELYSSENWGFDNEDEIEEKETGLSDIDFDSKGKLIFVNRDIPRVFDESIYDALSENDSSESHFEGKHNSSLTSKKYPNKQRNRRNSDVSSLSNYSEREFSIPLSNDLKNIRDYSGTFEELNYENIKPIQFSRRSSVTSEEDLQENNLAGPKSEEFTNSLSAYKEPESEAMNFKNPTSEINISDSANTLQKGLLGKEYENMKNIENKENGNSEKIVENSIFEKSSDIQTTGLANGTKDHLALSSEQEDGPNTLGGQNKASNIISSENNQSSKLQSNLDAVKTVNGSIEGEHFVEDLDKSGQLIQIDGESIHESDRDTKGQGQKYSLLPFENLVQGPSAGKPKITFIVVLIEVCVPAECINDFWIGLFVKSLKEQI